MKKIISKLFIFVLILATACSAAQDADKIHAMSSTNPFPISAKEYNEITAFKVGYFLTYRYVSNFVFHNALEVTGVLSSGFYFTTTLEIGLSDDNTYFFTGNSESCTALRKPRAISSDRNKPIFDDFGCPKGADYHATVVDELEVVTEKQ